MKIIIATLLILSSMASYSQNKTELSTIKFDEKPDAFLKGALEVREGKMFDRNDMISYGIDHNELHYKGYQPKHIELLTYKGIVSGYAFKISSIAVQEKILSFLQENYKEWEINKSKWQADHYHKDKHIVIELRSIVKEKFEQGMTGYLDVKSTAFNEVYDSLIKQYSKQE